MNTRMTCAAALIAIAATTIVATPAVAGSWETNSFRTANGQLVQVGMTKAEVLYEAGHPSGPKGKGGKHGSSWTYQGYDGYYTVTFRGDRVAKIEVIPLRQR